MKLDEALKTSRFKSDIHQAALNILYSAWWLKSSISRELKAFGITHEQYNILRILKGKHPEQMCVRDIASRMIEKNSNVPRILDRLVKKKLIRRITSSLDRRETAVSLTSAGLTLLENSGAHITTAIDRQISLNKQESKLLNELLDKMRENE
jgi:DNA-binding MarR family transcriptional regulator